MTDSVSVGRWNPVTDMKGFLRSSELAMSARTCGVAVAVNPATGGRPDAATVARGRQVEWGREAGPPGEEAGPFVDDDPLHVQLGEPIHEPWTTEPLGGEK